MIAVASCFSQLLTLVDRSAFARAVKQHKAERGAKGFSCWDQFVAMVFCQMGGANSLREICGGLATEGEWGRVCILLLDRESVDVTPLSSSMEPVSEFRYFLSHD